jgi:Carboxypeptidase regulatory-like domain
MGAWHTCRTTTRLAATDEIGQTAVKIQSAIVAGVIAGVGATLSLGAMGRHARGFPSIVAAAAQTPEDISGLTLRGSVVDTVTKKPIAGALVDLDGDPPRPGSHRPQQDANDTEQRTDANGEFTFRHVSWDSHFFSITKPGYTSATDDGIDYSSYEVRPVSQMEPLRMFLTPVAELAGHVTSETGAPLKGVALTLYNERVEDGRGIWVPQKNASTDAQGFYSFTGLKSGSYVVMSGWMFDHDPGEPAGSVCPSDLHPFVVQSGYSPTATPGVTDFSKAVPVLLPQGAHAVAGLKLRDQPFHRVSLQGSVSLGFPFGNGLVDRNGRAVTGPRNPKSQCVRDPFLYVDRGASQRTASLPDGLYTLHSHPSFLKDYGVVGKHASSWLGDYTTFTVAGSDMALPAKTVAPEPGPSTLIKGHFEALRLHPDHSENGTCNGTVRTSSSSPGDGKRSFPALWLSHADGLAEPVPQQRIQAQFQNSPTRQGDGPLAFGDLEAGKYWVHADETDTDYVSAITAGGVDLSHEPLVVGANGKSAPLEVTLRDDCGSLRLNYPWPKPFRNPVGIAGDFRALVVPQFAGFAVQRSLMFINDRGDDVLIGNLAPGHYKVYILPRERGVRFRETQPVPKDFPPGQDVWVKPGEKVEITVVGPPAE